MASRVSRYSPGISTAPSLNPGRACFAAQHGDADQQHRWACRVPEGLHAQLDTVDLDQLHEGPSGVGDGQLFLSDGRSGGANSSDPVRNRTYPDGQPDCAAGS